MSGRYVKKPVEVEAIQWTSEDNRAEVVAFAKAHTPHGPGDRVVHPEHGRLRPMRVWVEKSDRFIPIDLGFWLIAEPDGIGVYEEDRPSKPPFIFPSEAMAAIDALRACGVDSRLPEKGEPARCPECGSERRGAPSCGCGWHDGSPT